VPAEPAGRSAEELAGAYGPAVVEPIEHAPLHGDTFAVLGPFAAPRS
jgi:hypothetical protein